MTRPDRLPACRRGGPDDDLRFSWSSQLLRPRSCEDHGRFDVRKGLVGLVVTNALVEIVVGVNGDGQREVLDLRG